MSEGFVDPTPSLRDEYQEAIARLEAEFAERNGVLDRWRLWRSRKHLQRKLRMARASARW